MEQKRLVISGHLSFLGFPSGQSCRRHIRPQNEKQGTAVPHGQFRMIGQSERCRDR